MLSRGEAPRFASSLGSTVVCIVIALGNVSVSGCASSQHATGSTTLTHTAVGTEVQVQLHEYKIHMPTEVPAGHTILKISNTGSHDHNIKVTGPESAPEEDRTEAELPENLKPGATTELVLDLVPGTYKVICPVGPHKMLGMRLELTVTK